MTETKLRHRVVVIGGGFGGLEAVKTLANAEVEITLIDRRNHHLFQPLLYQVATATLSTSEIAWPIRQLVRRRADVTTLLGTVVDIDTAGHAVRLADGAVIEYDSLIIATGARHAYFGNDAWEKFAPGLKTLEDATMIRRKLLLAFEQAERTPDPKLREALLTFAIIGAGPTGVELAGAIIELAHTLIREDFRRLDPEDARVVLVEAGKRVLPNFAEDLSAYAQKALERLGVEVRLGQAVTAIDDEGVTYGDRHISARTVLWAAGVQASPAAQWLGVEPDRAGRVKVEADLTVPGHPDIFVVGDTALQMRENGRPVPGVGDAAKQGGRHAAKTIKARLRADWTAKPFIYHHAGDLATIGKKAAVIDFGWLKMRGYLAWWVWGLAHIYFLIGLRNRILVAINWLGIYLFGHRGARLITQGDAEAAASRKPGS